MGRARHAKTKVLMEVIYAIAQAQQPLTQRSIASRLVDLGHLPDLKKRSMSFVGRLCGLMREEGTLPWGWVIYRRETDPARTGVVYLLQAQGLQWIKIGWTANLERRLEGFRTASPLLLTLLRVIPTATPVALERQLHERYAAYRQHGEWFALPETLVAGLLQEAFPEWQPRTNARAPGPQIALFPATI